MERRRSEMQRIAVLRETMIRQQVMFKEQVRELHRLYQKQKILMAAELGTMDLLHCLNREEEQAEQSHGIRVKRRKTLDLEQLPDDNDEETEYIYDKPTVGLSKENSTLDFRDTERRPTLSLFPIPVQQTNHEIPAIAAQPYMSRLCEPWWTSLGQDGARVIGEIVRDCQQQHPSSLPNQASVSDLLFNANTGATANNKRNGLLESLQQQQRSYSNAPWHCSQHPSSLPQPAYSFTVKDSLAPPPPWLLSAPPRPTTFNGLSLEANRISWCSGNNFMLPGSSMKPPPAPLPVPSPPPSKVAVQAGGDEVAKPTTPLASASELVETGGAGRGRGRGTNNRIVNRLLGAPCTDTDSTPDSDKQVLDLNKNISCSVTNSGDDEADTITWAATILLSLAPENYKCSSQLSRAHDSPSSLLSADVKLFKSVVIMLRQSGGKAGKKLVVKSFNHGKDGGNHGKAAAAAATLLETLKKSVREVKEEREVEEEGKEDKSTKLVVGPRGSNGKRKSFTSWMWGDVTRKKRMQRHRSNHPQQVQQVRCL